MNLDSFLITGFSGVLGIVLSTIVFKTGVSTIGVIWGDVFILIIKSAPAFFSGLAFFATNEKWVKRKASWFVSLFRKKKR